MDSITCLLALLAHGDSTLFFGIFLVPLYCKTAFFFFSSPCTPLQLPQEKLNNHTGKSNESLQKYRGKQQFVD